MSVVSSLTDLLKVKLPVFGYDKVKKTRKCFYVVVVNGVHTLKLGEVPIDTPFQSFNTDIGVNVTMSKIQYFHKCQNSYVFYGTKISIKTKSGKWHEIPIYLDWERKVVDIPFPVDGISLM